MADVVQNVRPKHSDATQSHMLSAILQAGFDLGSLDCDRHGIGGPSP